VTRDEFEAAYAERSGITVEKLHDLGRWGEPCDCGEEGCEGWQMVSENTPRHPSEGGYFGPSPWR
jgi:hypothetical protein